jgi:hypothetical protein
MYQKKIGPYQRFLFGGFLGMALLSLVLVSFLLLNTVQCVLPFKYVTDFYAFAKCIGPRLHRITALALASLQP